MRPGSPHAIEFLRAQTGDPVCQQAAVLLAKIRDARPVWLGTAPPFCRQPGGTARVQGRWAGHRAGSGPSASMKGCSLGVVR